MHHGEATNIVLQWTDYVLDKFDRLTEKTSKTSQQTDRQTDRQARERVMID